LYSDLPPAVSFEQGAVNSVRIGKDIAVYSAGKATTTVRTVLVTAARRDSIGSVPADAVLLVPSVELDLFTEPEKFWTALETRRFHDYAQRSSKVPVQPAANVRAIAEGSEIPAGEVKLRAIATPGYTAGSLSYVIETAGKRVICTGDLIYGDGQIRDLYSLQDAVPEAKARGYHGYAARAGDLIASLRKVAALKPDVLYHGPRSPSASVDYPAHHTAPGVSQIISRRTPCAGIG
jgi:glyoxylase-like metal-dependent hydrolase (beta-lactamase superfamily II)